MPKLVRVFDNNYNFLNVVSALTLDFKELTFIYHHKIDTNQMNNCSEVIHSYKPDINIKFKYIKNDEKEVIDILDEDTTVDISTAKYLSAFLFEKAIEKKLMIIYYDDEESSIKNYNTHELITNKVFSLTIDDMVKLGGGTISSKKMHKHININDEETATTIIKVVDSNINKYSAFINYVQRINTFINNKSINDTSFKISDEIVNKIIHDELYSKIKNYHLFEIEDNILKFRNKDIRDMFSVSGAFLENYLYIKLSKSKMFDQVLMSSVIDFSKYYNRYPIACEIDCMAIRNNHLLFISCKSNKVDTDDLNEIKIHNTIFGNDLSDPVICTIEDLSKNAPAEYLKAKELKIAVIDKTSFINNSVVEDLINIVDGTYKYERV